MTAIPKKNMNSDGNDSNDRRGGVVLRFAILLYIGKNYRICYRSYMRYFLLKIRFFLYTVIIAGLLVVLQSGNRGVQKQSDTAVPGQNPISQFGQMVLSAYSDLTETSNGQVRYTAWIPDWDYDAGVEGFMAHATTFSQVNPIWFHIDQKGKLNPTEHEGDPKLMKLTDQYNILLIPTIQEFEANYLHEAIKNENAIENHITDILKVVDRYHTDGIDLDYEMIYLKDKDNFYSFLKQLSTELKKRRKKLTVDVISKTSDETGAYNTLVETRQVQDWSILANYVDEIRIMVYDYANSTPGGSPINPYPWVQEVVKYAVTKADPNKFILGTPLYAYSWKNGELFKAYTYDVVKEGIEKRNATPVFDEEAKEWRVELADDDGTQVVWYQDARSVGYRLDLVKRYGLGGLVFWRLGGEDRGIYSLLH